MIYIIGFQQDIVFSFVKSLGPSERYTLIPFERLSRVRFESNEFTCDEIETDERLYSLSAKDRIYLRPYSFAAALELGIMPDDEIKRMRRLYLEIMFCRQTWLGYTSLRSDSNNNKFLHPCAFSGLVDVPNLELTNQEDARPQHDHVVKSASFVRTRVVSEDEFHSAFSDTNDGKILPLIVRQKRVGGTPVRITVIGFETVIAAEIPSSGGIDFRYADTVEPIPIRLPTQIEFKAKAIARRYGLPLCGLDFLHDNDDWHFLEVNPEPGWAFLGRAQNQEIFEKILEFLSSEHWNVAPDESWEFIPALHTQITITDAVPKTLDFPARFLPSDYIARPGEEHPFWSTP